MYICVEVLERGGTSVSTSSASLTSLALPSTSVTDNDNTSTKEQTKVVTYTGFPLFWKKKFQEFSNPILEFSRCFRS